VAEDWGGAGCRGGVAGPDAFVARYRRGGDSAAFFWPKQLSFGIERSTCLGSVVSGSRGLHAKSKDVDRKVSNQAHKARLFLHLCVFFSILLFSLCDFCPTLRTIIDAILIFMPFSPHANSSCDGKRYYLTVVYN
jgi:hypothetical protein